MHTPVCSCPSSQGEAMLWQISLALIWTAFAQVAVPRSAKKAEEQQQQQQQQQQLGSTNGCVRMQVAASSSSSHAGPPLGTCDADRGSALKTSSSGQEDLFGITTDGRAEEVLAAVAAPGIAGETDAPSKLAGPELQQRGRRSAAKHKHERQAQRGPRAGGQEWAPGRRICGHFCWVPQANGGALVVVACSVCCTD